MKMDIFIIICAVVLTLFAAFIGLWIDDSGTFAVVFAVAVMGAFILYALLLRGKDPSNADKPDDTKKPCKTDKPQD